MKPDLDQLPCIPGDELTLLCAVDVYDGPISGLVSHFSASRSASDARYSAEPRATSRHVQFTAKKMG